MILILLLIAFGVLAYCGALTEEISFALLGCIAFAVAYYVGKAWAEGAMANGEENPAGGITFAIIVTAGLVLAVSMGAGAEPDPEMLLWGAGGLAWFGTMALGASCARVPEGYDPADIAGDEK